MLAQSSRGTLRRLHSKILQLSWWFLEWDTFKRKQKDLCVFSPDILISYLLKLGFSSLLISRRIVKSIFALVKAKMGVIIKSKRRFDIL